MRKLKIYFYLILLLAIHSCSDEQTEMNSPKNQSLQRIEKLKELGFKVQTLESSIKYETTPDGLENLMAYLEISHESTKEQKNEGIFNFMISILDDNEHYDLPGEVILTERQTSNCDLVLSMDSFDRTVEGGNNGVRYNYELFFRHYGAFGIHCYFENETIKRPSKKRRKQWDTWFTDDFFAANYGYTYQLDIIRTDNTSGNHRIVGEVGINTIDATSTYIQLYANTNNKSHKDSFGSAITFGN